MQRSHGQHHTITIFRRQLLSCCCIAIHNSYINSTTFQISLSKVSFVVLSSSCLHTNPNFFLLAPLCALHFPFPLLLFILRSFLLTLCSTAFSPYISSFYHLLCFFHFDLSKMLSLKTTRAEKRGREKKSCAHWKPWRKKIEKGRIQKRRNGAEYSASYFTIKRRAPGRED